MGQPVISKEQGLSLRWMSDVATGSGPGPEAVKVYSELSVFQTSSEIVRTMLRMSEITTPSSAPYTQPLSSNEVRFRVLSGGGRSCFVLNFLCSPWLSWNSLLLSLEVCTPGLALYFCASFLLGVDIVAVIRRDL